ncbi:MerR family transcriptional regulator [Clostridium sp. Marseille-P2415]|uniref:MerR family transcriptional regulator n=1 Tax=Clostridium sp. Marseille-P2415 TaxID=1805471 RepID=UPI0009883CEF|nr:MerR family transcriptional regulator [Clostridium sp. Marseille-P2415]
MKDTYTTSEIAKIIGIHPNTVRLYEDLKLISQPDRLENGYRIFTGLHVEQFYIARLAFQVEVLQNGLRKKAVKIIKASANQDFDRALVLTRDYLEQLKEEKRNAEDAILIAERILTGSETDTGSCCLTRKQTADYLNISIDTLRNWELNGLLTVKRKKNGYRVYTSPDLKRLKIIRSLRCANYSLASILRMLHILSSDPGANIRAAIDAPQGNDDILTACDNLLTSLNHAETNAQLIQKHLVKMKRKFS